jgi:hypothetical protein
MADLVKIIGTEIALSTANTVGNASVVRILNNTAGPVLITRKDSATTTLGTVTLASNELIYLQKTSDDTLTSNTAVRAVSVAYN